MKAYIRIGSLFYCGDACSWILDGSSRIYRGGYAVTSENSAPQFDSRSAYKVISRLKRLGVTATRTIIENL